MDFYHAFKLDEIMKFTLSRTELLTALSITGKAVKQGFVPATSCYKFFHTGDMLTISACNMEIQISKRIENKGDKLDVLIPADRLKAWVQSLPEQPITFNFKPVKDDFALEVSTISSSCKLACYNGVESPEIKINDGDYFLMPYNEFASSLDKVAFTRLADDSGNVLNGLSVEISDKFANFVAYNGFSFAIHKVLHELTPGRLLLPTSIVSALIGTQLDGIARISYNEGKICLSVNDVEIKGILMDGNYIGWEAAMITPDYSITCDRNELLSAMKRALILTNKQTNKLIISILGDVLSVMGQDELMEYSGNEIVTCSKSASGLTIGFNGQYAIDGLSRMESEQVVIFYSEQSKPLLFKESVESESFNLLAPITI